jgi:hypothetical protein
MKYIGTALAVLVLALGLLSCGDVTTPTVVPVIRVVSLGLVYSVPAPDEMISPGGAHTVGITLKNTGKETIMYVRATLKVTIPASGIEKEEKYDFDALIDIRPAHPLLPDETRTGTFSIPGQIAIMSSVPYPVKLHVTLKNETLDYIQQYPGNPTLVP